MSLTMRTADLLAAVDLAASVIRTHHLTPESGYCRLRCDGKSWSLLATNYETTVLSSGPLQGAKESYCLPVRLTQEILKLSPAEYVTISDAGDERFITGYERKPGGQSDPVYSADAPSISLVAGSAVYTVQKNVFEAKLGQLTHSKPDERTLAMPAQDLADRLGSVLPLVPQADDACSYNLKACCLDYDAVGQRLCFAAGETTYFGVRPVAPWSGEWKGSVLIPVKAAHVFHQALRHGGAGATLSWTQHELVLDVEPSGENPGCKVVTRSMDGNFLPWQRILEVCQQGPAVTLRWKDLTAGERIAATAGDDIRVDFKPEGLILTIDGVSNEKPARSKTYPHAAVAVPLAEAAPRKLAGWAVAGPTLKWLKKLKRDPDELVQWRGAPAAPNLVQFADGTFLVVSPAPRGG